MKDLSTWKKTFWKKIALLNKQDLLQNMLFIVGAQKSGTTALFEYLLLNSRFSPCLIKEPGFFNKPALYKRGISWYAQQFYPFSKGKIHFEATPGYMYIPGTAERIYQHFPEAKIVAVLREPVGRAFSAWNMYDQLIKSPQKVSRLRSFHIKYGNTFQRDIMTDLLNYKDLLPPFLEVVQDELDHPGVHTNTIGASILRRGLYYEQLKVYFDLFPQESIKVYGSNRLRTKPASILNEIETWCGLQPKGYSHALFPEHHKRSYSKRMTNAEIDTVMKYFEPSNKALYDMLGFIPDW